MVSNQSKSKQYKAKQSIPNQRYKIKIKKKANHNKNKLHFDKYK